jgi:hypothetical protein
MAYSGRFQMIRSTQGLGLHVGVLDNKWKRVLELTTEDYKVAKIQEIAVTKFGHYIVINPLNPVDDDETIEERWKKTLNDYEDFVEQGKCFEYDASGIYNEDYEKWNCEVLAESVMTGIKASPQGRIAALLRDWLGIRVAPSRSGSPRRSDSWGSSW